MPVKNLISFRKGTATQWEASSQPLASGEPGYDVTNNILKIGNGIDTWSNLKNIVSISGDATIAGNLNIDGLKVSATTNLNYPINLYDALTIDEDGVLEIKSGNKTLFYTGAEESEGVLNNTRIGGFDGCSIDKTIIGENTPSVGIFSILSATESIGVSGSLVVQNGSLRIYEDGGPYSTTVSSSGLKINYTTSLTDVDLADSTSSPTPTGWLNNFSLDGRGTLLFFPRRPLVGEKILFRNFSDPKNNGVYQLQQVYNSGIPIDYLVTPIRVSPYANNATIANLSRVKNKYDNSVYILNPSSNGGSSTVGTSNLVFSIDPGEQVMTIQSTRDVDFVAAVSAREKYFRIKHPDPESEYSVLQYGSLESPYNGVRLTGRAELKKGICKVQLPSYIKYLISEQNMNVQLTNKSHHKILYVDTIDLQNNCFTVKGYRAKTGGPFEFFWTFTGTRKDVDPLIVEH